jgi:hypothetical protein
MRLRGVSRETETTDQPRNRDCRYRHTNTPSIARLQNPRSHKRCATCARQSAGRAFAVLAARHVYRAPRLSTFSEDGNGCRAVGGNLDADMMLDNVFPLRFCRLAMLLGFLCGWTGHSSSSLRLCTRSTLSFRLRGNRLQSARASLFRKVQDGQVGIGICP